MSFSSDIKNELAALSNESDCCDVAQCYGMAEFSRSFSTSAVALQTENEAAAVRYRGLLESVCGITAEHSEPWAGRDAGAVLRRAGFRRWEFLQRLHRGRC